MTPGGEQNLLVQHGFGERLKEERKRLGLNQQDFGDLVGVQRLAQSQYETETREPRLSYLDAAGKIGVDLRYLLFSKREPLTVTNPALRVEIERAVFCRIEQYAGEQANGHLSPDARYVLFELARAFCLNAADSGQRVEVALESFFLGRQD